MTFISIAGLVPNSKHPLIYTTYNTCFSMRQSKCSFLIYTVHSRIVDLFVDTTIWHRAQQIMFEKPLSVMMYLEKRH